MKTQRLPSRKLKKKSSRHLQKTRKEAKAPPKPRPQKKQAKPSPAKPNTRLEASTRVAIQKAKEKGKEKAKEKAIETKGEELAKKRLRRKYVATPKSEEETEDTSQFKVVINPT